MDLRKQTPIVSLSQCRCQKQLPRDHEQGESMWLLLAHCQPEDGWIYQGMGKVASHGSLVVLGIEP